MANTLRLEQLFRQCDTSGSGLICCEDFQDLCAGFGIEEVRLQLELRAGLNTFYFGVISSLKAPLYHCTLSDTLTVVHVNVDDTDR